MTKSNKFDPSLPAACLELRTQVSKSRLMRDLRAIAPFDKPAGSRSEKESLSILETLLTEAGFATRQVWHDAWISLPGPAQLIVGGRQADCITHSMAAACGGLEGPMSRGAEAGKIAVLDGIARPDALREAERAGALAAIFVSPNERLYEMCVSPVWGSPDMDDLERLPGIPAITVRDSVRAHLAYAIGTGSPARIDAQVETGWRRTPILEAELDLGGDGFVLLSGHHDTWHKGVMDNGAANATMLEIARLVADAARARPGVMRRNLRLCIWSGHSQGRYSGSAHYADTEWQTLSRDCVAHVNVDSTGGEGAERLDLSGVSPQLRALVAEAVAGEGQEHLGRRPGRDSDQSFWGIGVPSAFGCVSHHPEGTLPTRLGPWWHTPEDLIEHVSPELLARDTRVVLHVVQRLMSDEVLPLDNSAWCSDLRAELARLSIAPDVGLDRVEAVLEQLELALRADLTEDVARAVTRRLVPLDHLSGDRFSPDLALKRSDWPLLQPLRTLAQADPESDAARHHRVAALRAANRLIEGLQSALAETPGRL